MTILHIVGKPRKGKGVLMSKLTLEQADMGQIVDSNYHLWKEVPNDMPNINFITFYDLLNFLKKPRQEPEHLLNIDELPGWCDSYVTQAKSSRYASHFINQSAKLGYDLIFTSQRSKRADINFRELSDQRFHTERNALCGIKKCDLGCPYLVNCNFSYQPMDMNELEEDIPKGKPLRLTFLEAAITWNRFDTFEAVPPIGLDEVLMEMQKFDHEKLNATVWEQCRALQEGYPNEVFATVNAVSELLLDLGISRQFAGLVHARLQRIQRQNKQQTNRMPMMQGTVPQTPKEDRRLVWQRWRK